MSEHEDANTDGWTDHGETPPLFLNWPESDATPPPAQPPRLPRQRRGARRRAATMAVTAGVGAALGAAGTYLATQKQAAIPETSAAVRPVAGATPQVRPSSAAAIAAKVDPGLVDINTVLSYQSEEAAGTGMVITKNGEVLTNNHVIEGATSISVTDIGNGRTYSATVVGYDRTHDVAVLQLQGASNLKTVPLGNSSSVKVGTSLVALGNAGGTGGTPSEVTGSATSLDQSITASDEGSGTSEQLSGLIETNAPIQPGDSGGPLVNRDGKVIGMDTAASAGFQFQFANAQSSSTQGFAIPIDTALRIAKQIESGTASSTVHIGATAFLGVDVENAGSASVGGNGFGTPGGSNGFGGFGGFGFGFGGFGFGSEGEGYGSGSAPGEGSSGGATTTSGAEIVGVISGSAAAQAGLAEGDTITSVNGQAVTSPDSLTTVMSGEKPGSSIQIGYVDTSGTAHTATVVLTAGPPQ